MWAKFQFAVGVLSIGMTAAYSYTLFTRHRSNQNLLAYERSLPFPCSPEQMRELERRYKAITGKNIDDKDEDDDW